MNGVQTRFKCKLDVKRCKRFVFPPSSLLPRSNALKTKAIRYFQTDRTLTRIVSPPLLAYLRIKDENILATPVHLRVWQQSGSPRGELITYTEREQLLLDLLEENDSLSLNRYCRLARLSRRAAEHLLAKFIRFDIVEPVFEGHKFHFRLK